MINKITNQNTLPQESRFRVSLHTVLAVALGTLIVFASLWMAFHAPLAVGKIGWALSGTVLCGALLLSLVNLKYLVKNYKQERAYQLIKPFLRQQMATSSQVKDYMDEVIGALRNDPRSINKTIKLFYALRIYIANNNFKLPDALSVLDIMQVFFEQLFNGHNFYAPLLEDGSLNSEYDLEKSKALMYIWLRYPRSQYYLRSEFIFSIYQKCSQEEQERFCKNLLDGYTQCIESLSAFPHLNEKGRKLLLIDFLFEIGNPKYLIYQIILSEDLKMAGSIMDQFDLWKEDAVFKRLRVQESLDTLKLKAADYKASIK